MKHLPPPTATTPRTARGGRLTALVALNVLLAGVAAAGLLSSHASAQQGGPARARGNYLMVSGRATGLSGNVVYVVDTVNQELVALRYQRAAGRLEPMGYRNLAVDSSQGASNR